MRAVIEKTAIPELVAALAAFMKVEVVSAVEFVQAVQNVFAGVRVDDVEEYC